MYHNEQVLISLLHQQRLGVGLYKKFNKKILSPIIEKNKKNFKKSNLYRKLKFKQFQKIKIERLYNF